MGAALSATAAHRPPVKRESVAPPAVDAAEFLRTLREMDLVAVPDLDRIAGVAAGDVTQVARMLVREGHLTGYQAGAMLQGKAHGLLIGRNVVLEKVGMGGMGVVFKARHRPSGRVVALKMLPPSFGRDPEVVRRFRREFEVASRLSHPNIVAAIEANEDRGVHFLTMDYIQGYDFAHFEGDGGGRLGPTRARANPPVRGFQRPVVGLARREPEGCREGRVSPSRVC